VSELNRQKNRIVNLATSLFVTHIVQGENVSENVNLLNQSTASGNPGNDTYQLGEFP
jgi:hypothetical protein